MKYLVNNKIINAANITVVYRTASETVKIYTVDSDELFIELTGIEADRFWAVYSADALDVMEGEAA